MKGLLIFILLLSSSLRAQEPYSIVTPAYIEFAHKYDTFNRKLLGCPLEPDFITKEDCFPKRGIFDAKLWKELNSLSAKVFTYEKTNGKVRSRQESKR